MTNAFQTKEDVALAVVQDHALLAVITATTDTEVALAQENQCKHSSAIFHLFKITSTLLHNNTHAHTHAHTLTHTLTRTRTYTSTAFTVFVFQTFYFANYYETTFDIHKIHNINSREEEDINPGDNLFITGLSIRTNGADLEELFVKYGKVN